MIRKLSLIIVGTTALVACKPETIVGGEQPDPMKDELANAAPVELPPAIAASKTYRCKDNSLVYVDWYVDGSARVKTAESDTGTQVPAPAEGVKPSLVGDANSASITYNGQGCKA